MKTDVKTGNKENTRTNIVELGIDLREFYKSVEWDILSVPAARYRNEFSHSNTCRKMSRSEMQKRTSGTSVAGVKFSSWCKNSGGECDNGWFKKLLCRESRNFGVNFLVLRSIYCIYFGL